MNRSPHRLGFLLVTGSAVAIQLGAVELAWLKKAATPQAP
jgi:hypothetical protein